MKILFSVALVLCASACVPANRSSGLSFKTEIPVAGSLIYAQ